MRAQTRNFFVATATMIGTIIGVGVFGVPYAISQIGLWGAVGLFVSLGSIQLIQHLFFAEAAIASKEQLRLVGLVRKYLGGKWHHLAGICTVFGFWGGMVAYYIVGGTFLHTLFSPWLGGSVLAYQVGWALTGWTLTYFGLKFVSRLDFFATCGVLATMFVILVACARHANVSNLIPYTGIDVFLPYGVILFSLSGMPCIAELEDIFEGRHKLYRTAIVVGSLIAAAFTAAFGFLVWAATGSGVTHDAVSGLAGVLGPKIQTLAAVFGFLAVTTSYFATTLNLQSTFRFDYKISRPVAWVFAGAVPFVILLSGAKDFVSVISFSGAVFGGITSVLVSALYISITRKGLVKSNPLGMPIWVAFLTIAVLGLGATYEIVHSGLEILGAGA